MYLCVIISFIFLVCARVCFLKKKKTKINISFELSQKHQTCVVMVIHQKYHQQVEMAELV